MKFVTIHLLHTLPLHNMNRDASGLPKSQFDGGVQRARLSSQSLKRAARNNYLGTNTGTSVRTQHATQIALDVAIAHATAQGFELDQKKTKDTIKKVIDGLAKKADEAKKAEEAEKIDDANEEGESPETKDNVLFFAVAELETLGRAAADKLREGTPLERDDFLLDATSPTLDVAAFGRMFAAATEVGTHAAVAVSHAATTHPMSLTADYFSAVEDRADLSAASRGAGAAHIGMAYYTSGVYYRSFTIDADQLRRSWSSYTADGAPQDLADLVRALITSLPSGRVSNSNPHTIPTIVLAEAQRCRVAYDFDQPVQADNGGYKRGSVAALAAQRRLAQRFDPANTPDAVVVGETFEEDFADARQGDGLEDVIAFVLRHAFDPDPAEATH